MKNNTAQQTIPSGWVIKKMDDFIKNGSIALGRGEVISKADIKNYPGENPIYSSSVKNNALFGKYAKYMFDEELITWSVDGGGDFFYRPKHKFSVTNVSGYLNVDQKQFDYKFLAYYLQEEHSKKSFDYQNKAHPSVIRELYVIAKPPIKEQQKIAQILGTVDEDISRTQEVIETTEKLKRGLMQQLFTRGIGHTKFKETKIGQIPEEWEVAKIGDHSVHVGSGATPRGGSKVYLTEGIPFIRSQNVYFDGLIQEDLTYISEHTHEEMSRSKTLPNDVLLNITGASIGRACIVPADLLDANVNQHVCIIRPSKDLLFGYLFYFLQSQLGQNQIFKFQIGGNREGLNFQQIRSIELSLPKNFDEQKEIAEILSAVDEKILVNKKLKEKLTLLKKGLMQDLLSGKVRTV